MKKNVIVHREDGRFCGWPANHGMWCWGNEILVAFKEGKFHNISHDHAFDRSEPTRVLMGRSLDGGETWSITDPEMKKFPDLPKGVRINMNDVGECPGGIDFSNPDFCLNFAMSACDSNADSWWYWSGDRGHSWNGPYSIPNFGFPNIQARTDYHVLNKDEVLIFLTAGRHCAEGREGRVICVKLCEGGKRFELVGLVGEEPNPEGHCIMPTTGIRKNGEIVCICRIWYVNMDGSFSFFAQQFSSADQGKTWKFDGIPIPCTGDYNGNPAALVVMKDGTWALSYGVRREPYRICVRFSDDEGRTWGKEQIVRDDGGSWDLGYPRMVEREDGKLVVAYYYSTNPTVDRHVAATFFDREL